MALEHILINDTAFGVEVKEIIEAGEKFMAGLRSLQGKMDTMVTAGPPANFSNVAQQFGLTSMDPSDLDVGQTFYNLLSGAKGSMEGTYNITSFLNRCGQNLFGTP